MSLITDMTDAELLTFMVLQKQRTAEMAAADAAKAAGDAAKAAPSTPTWDSISKERAAEMAAATMAPASPPEWPGITHPSEAATPCITALPAQ